MADSTTDQEFKYEDEFVIAYLYIRESLTKAFLNIIRKPEHITVDYEALEISLCTWLEKILSIDLIDDRSLKDALKHTANKTEPLERRISKGKLAVPGRNGKLVLLVKPFTPTFEGEYKLWDRFQKRFDSILEGQTVARIYLPVNGTDGIDVFGRPILAPLGTEIQLQMDSSTLEMIPSSTNSYKEVKARKSGYLTSSTDSKKNTTLKIETIYQIGSDIDHSIGSLDFIGGATIRGSVMKGFQVLCKDEIIIRGDVFDAKIESKEASITINGNIIGSEEEGISLNNLQYDDLKWIKAKFDVQTKALESQAIYAGRSIIITSNSVRSILCSGSQITVYGSLFASRARTVCGIEVGSLGNSSGVHTEIEFLPIEEAGENFLELETKIIRLKNREETLSLFLGPYLSNPKELSRLASGHKEKIKTSVQVLAQTKKQIESLEIEKEKLSQGTNKNIISRLNVNKEVFPGVIISRKDKKYSFNERKKGPFTLAYLWDEDKFEMRALEDINCEWTEIEMKKEKK